VAAVDAPEVMERADADLVLLLVAATLGAVLHVM
jgi:hypothetical protein